MVLYLCLGGLGGGLSAIAGVAGLSIPRRFMGDGSFPQYSGFMRSAFVAALASLVLGGLLLLADSGNFSALPYLFFAPPFGYLSIGAWVIAIDIGLCFVLVLFWRSGVGGERIIALRVLHGACALAGLVVALYTGFFLASMKAVPLWNTPLLPPLFTLSAISCGIVFFLALAQANGGAVTFRSPMRFLAKVDVAIIALEAVCAAVLVLGLSMAPLEGSAAAAGAASALDLTSGEYAWVWWGGFAGLGLVATAVLDVFAIRTHGNPPGRIWATLGVSFCVLVGAFSLRYCIVMAGMHPALGF